jgi:hypothetical protein
VGDVDAAFGEDLNDGGVHPSGWCRAGRTDVHGVSGQMVLEGGGHLRTAGVGSSPAPSTTSPTSSGQADTSRRNPVLTPCSGRRAKGGERGDSDGSAHHVVRACLGLARC